MINYYEFLKVSPNATQEEISEACKKVRKRNRRILELGSTEARVKAEEDLSVLDEAMNTLLVPEKRKEYDDSLLNQSESNEKFNDEEDVAHSDEAKRDGEKKRHKYTVPIQVQDIPIENYEINRPEFYFTNDVNELWKLYCRYKSKGDRENSRFCFRKLMMMHYHDERVQKELAEYNFSYTKYKVLGWISFFAVVLILFVYIPSMLAAITAR